MKKHLQAINQLSGIPEIVWVRQYQQGFTFIRFRQETLLRHERWYCLNNFSHSFPTITVGNDLFGRGIPYRKTDSEYLSYKEEVGSSNLSTPTDNKPLFHDRGFFICIDSLIKTYCSKWFIFMHLLSHFRDMVYDNNATS